MSSSKQRWHAPWKLDKVISCDNVGATVRCCSVERKNQFFLTGSDDGSIKIWDLDSGKLKTTLTNAHTGGIRGLGYSSYCPYFYSCGEGGQVKCWDVEYNKVIHEYVGHVSTVNSLVVGFLLITIGRDCSAKSWDLRSSHLVRAYKGHTAEVSSLVYRDHVSDIVTGSRDRTIRIWNLALAMPEKVLINHKNSVKALVLNSALNEFVSASQDSIKKWTADGELIENLPKRNATINCLAVNKDDVLVSGNDDGRMQFWDWRSGYNFQTLRVPVRSGSRNSETDIHSVTFDMSGSRLITTGADKTIKIYKEDETASEESP